MRDDLVFLALSAVPLRVRRLPLVRPLYLRICRHWMDKWHPRTDARSDAMEGEQQ